MTTKPKQHECPHGLNGTPGIVPWGGPIDFTTGDGYYLCGDLGARCHACREDAMERRHNFIKFAHQDHEDRADARAILAEYSFNRPEAKLDDIIMTLTGIQQALRGGGKEGDDE